MNLNHSPRKAVQAFNKCVSRKTFRYSSLSKHPPYNPIFAPRHLYFSQMVIASIRPTRCCDQLYRCSSKILPLSRDAITSPVAYFLSIILVGYRGIF